MTAPRPLTPMEHAILATLADGQARSTAEIAAAIGLDPYGASTALGRLKEARRVVRIGLRMDDAGGNAGWGSGKRTPHAVWALPASG